MTSWLERYNKNKKTLMDANLYHPSQEHDACGVGFIASIDGIPNRRVVISGIEALKAVWHRGAVDADGKTGDGAGIHVEIPKLFFEDEVKKTGHEIMEGDLGIGMIFLPRNDYSALEKCRTIVESELLNHGYYIYGWRQVPLNTSVLGRKANSTRPEIEQVMFVNNIERSKEEDLDKELFLIRRKIEKRILNLQISEFYICSLSFNTVIYKGLFLAEHLSTFFPDLEDDRFISSFSIFHQRYSTNTFPSWALAQPFRTLAHNGEINTISGNTNWMRNHETRIASELFGENSDQIKPIIVRGSSDSSALDAAFEMFVRAGRSAPLTKTLLMPEAWSKRSKLIPESHRNMYEFANAVIEPWDGPAAIAAYDGEWVIGGMDRNGLRPMRYTITDSNLIFAGSETGMVPVNEEEIIYKGRLGPGDIIGVNLKEGKLYENFDLKDKLANEHPYHEWVKKIIRIDKQITSKKESSLFNSQNLRQRKIAAGYTMEELELILHPMVDEAKESTGSMGDDTPIAILSDKYRPLSHFFRQKFSQVTNPPIDSIREQSRMSLKTRFGNLRDVLDSNSYQESVFVMDSPVVTNSIFNKMLKFGKDESVTIDCCFPVKDTALKENIKRIQDEAEAAVLSGKQHIVLTDMNADSDNVSVPMILATAAVHSSLTRKGIRSFISLHVQSAECLDTHYFAVLIGVGATTVNPYLAQECIRERHSKGLFGDYSYEECVARFKKAVDQGLLKIMAKLGISVVSAYRGGFNFEVVGLSRSMVNEYFLGVQSRISGIGLSGIEHKIKELHKYAFSGDVATLPIGGIYRYRNGGEAHAYDGKLIHLLQAAVSKNSYDMFKTYSEAHKNFSPINIRDLLAFKSKKELQNINNVESITSIRKRFGSGSMSHGSLSKEAHETLAIAMNRIGGSSCSGEGGESIERSITRKNGDNANSRVKQVASARFGVTAEYLNNCEEIEIKISQGAKPGEGGQLPGFKVTAEIAKLRHSTIGVTLISPPPHHDIYSIEDLAQLIFDLKQINPNARVCVKLVASSGIGTIAAGVAKAKADIILISGHNGGTGASPQTSIKYAGIPWEMGLTEVNQVLTLNGLRQNVVLRTDGGIKTGRDVAIAALMGAEEFNLGTTSLVAMGCIMVRQCHSNTCPVGVCTQDDDLRERFSGTADKVVNLFSFIAEEVREIIAELGFTKLEEIIGRTDLLSQISRGSSHLDDLDLNSLLIQAEKDPEVKYFSHTGINDAGSTLDEKIILDASKFFDTGQKIELSYSVKNTDRTIGSKLSSFIYNKVKDSEINDDQITLNLSGSAGQSLGAFAVKGLTIKVEGDANDYVGKSLSGGKIVLRPDRNSKIKPKDNTILGNTCMYGATSGYLYASGHAGERFAVRNSGATTVVEGCGSNGCEYMTGGNVIILGQTGDNFGAGMTGGMAYIYDIDKKFKYRVNEETLIYQGIQSNYWENVLKNFITDHYNETGSLHAKKIIDNWESELSNFIQICPKEIVYSLKEPLIEKTREKKVT
jgi:glutamate synthase (NADPH/NADH) large chain